MNNLREFEVEVIRLLGNSTPFAEILHRLVQSRINVQIDYTGVGYFLTIDSPSLPESRAILSDPVVVAEVDGIECGFIAFIEHHSLMLECYTYGDDCMAPDFRDRTVVPRIQTSVPLSQPEG